MGQKKARRERFLAQHPDCYMCGAPATTIDHIPSRQSFDQRRWPEGFAFAACQPCNSATSSIEQGVALAIKLFDHSAKPSKRDLELVEDLLEKVSNNTPEMVPQRIDDLAEKERRLAEYGYVLTEGETVAEAGLVQMQPGWRNAMLLFATKLLAALYYKENGRRLPKSYLARTAFMPFRHRDGAKTIATLQAMMPNFVVGSRGNAPLGNQFQYVWNAPHDGNLFLFIAQFRQSWFFFGSSANPDILEEVHEEYVPFEKMLHAIGGGS